MFSLSGESGRVNFLSYLFLHGQLLALQGDDSVGNLLEVLDRQFKVHESLIRAL